MIKKAVKALKILGIGLASIVALVLILLLLSVPISRAHENLPPSVGVNIDKLALRGVSIVLPDSNQVLSDQTLLINQGKIAGIQADSVDIPSGFEIKEGDGRFVMHALADMHVHIFDRTDLALYLSYGITHVRNMMGFPMHLRWRDELQSGRMVGSTMVTASPTMNHGEDGGPFHKFLESPEAAEKAVIDAKMEGYDFIKIYDGLTPELLEKVASTARDQNLEFAGHPPRSVELADLYKSGIASIEHVEEVFQGLLRFKFDEEKAREIAQDLKRSGIPVTVTFSAYNHLYRTVVEKDAFLRELPIEYISPMTRFIGQKQLAGWINTSEKGYDWTVKKYAFMKKLVKILQDEGVTLLLGTDQGPNLTVPGWNLHREIEMLQEAGLSPQQIICSGTSQAAPILKSASFPGSLKVGSAANLVITWGNPLQEIGTLEMPSAVISRGKWYDHHMLKELRTYALEGQSPWYITLGRFLEHWWNL